MLSASARSYSHESGTARAFVMPNRGDAMAICRLCGDTCDLGEDWCTSCLIDVEAEIDEMLDAPTPGVD